MWARISEMILGIWLFVSHFVWETQVISDFVCSGLILFFALLSYVDRLNKTHLLQVIPAGWLLYLGYTYPTPWLPIFMQNYILIALALLMFCIVPSHASDHPRPWQNFLNRQK